MDATSTGVAVHRLAGEGPALWSMGSLFEVKLAAGESDASFGLMEVTQPPGVATPLHVHRREAEAFYLLEGELIYEAGGDLYELRRGGFLYLPKDVPHRFRVTGASPARFLAIVAPGGIEALYAEVGRPADDRTLPPEPPSPQDVQRWLEAAPGSGIEILGPPLPPA